MEKFDQAFDVLAQLSRKTGKPIRGPDLTVYPMKLDSYSTGDKIDLTLQEVYLVKNEEFGQKIKEETAVILESKNNPYVFDENEPSNQPVLKTSGLKDIKKINFNLKNPKSEKNKIEKLITSSR